MNDFKLARSSFRLIYNQQEFTYDRKDASNRITVISTRLRAIKSRVDVKIQDIKVFVEQNSPRSCRDSCCRIPRSQYQLHPPQSYRNCCNDIPIARWFQSRNLDLIFYSLRNLIEFQSNFELFKLIFYASENSYSSVYSFQLDFGL